MLYYAWHGLPRIPLLSGAECAHVKVVVDGLYLKIFKHLFELGHC